MQKQHPNVSTELLGNLLIADAIDQLREALAPTPQPRTDETPEQHFARIIVETMLAGRDHEN
jgi:hypothetical protein